MPTTCVTRHPRLPVASQKRSTSPRASLADTPTGLTSFRQFFGPGSQGPGTGKDDAAAKADAPAESELVRKVKSKLRAAAYTSGGVDYAKLFKHYDRDNSGSLEFDEFRSALRRDAKIKVTDVSDLDLREVFNTVDEDGGGEVEIDEFVEWLGRTGAPKVTPRKRSPKKKKKKVVAAGGGKSKGASNTTAATPPGGAARRVKKARKPDTPLVKAVKQKLRAAAYTAKGMDFARLFKHYDRDNSGAIDFNEFRSAIRRDAKITANQVSDHALRKVFNTVDDDGGGEVEIDEFVEWLGVDGRTASKPKPKPKAAVPPPAPAATDNAPPVPPPATASAGGSKKGAAKKKKKRRVDSPLVKAVKIKLRAAAYTSKGMDFARLFKHYDRDNSGALDFNEFRSAIRRDAKITANQVSDKELQRVFNSVDDDGGGEVEIDEFVEWLGLSGPKQKPKAAASGDEDEKGGDDESPRLHRRRHRHRRHHSPRTADSEHGTDADEVAASVAVDEEAGLDAEAAAADARRLEAARAALWDDVFEVPDDLLVHSGKSHALKQQLQQVKQRLQTAPTPWEAQPHERRASVGSAADSEPSRAQSHGSHHNRDAASSTRRGEQRDRRSDRSSRSPEGDSSTVAAANGDHLAYLESQYAALFGQDGKVASTLRDLGVLQSPVLQQEPNGTKAKTGAAGEGDDSEGATKARPSATASSQPANATAVPPPAPETKAR